MRPAERMVLCRCRWQHSKLLHLWWRQQLRWFRHGRKKERATHAHTVSRRRFDNLSFVFARELNVKCGLRNEWFFAGVGGNSASSCIFGGASSSVGSGVVAKREATHGHTVSRRRFGNLSFVFTRELCVKCGLRNEWFLQVSVATQQAPASLAAPAAPLAQAALNL